MRASSPIEEGAMCKGAIRKVIQTLNDVITTQVTIYSRVQVNLNASTTI